MRIRKILSTVMMFTILMTVFTGCASAEVDVEKLSSSLAQEIEYSVDLYEVSDEYMDNYFTLEDGVSAVMYMSSGMTAEEFAIFTCKDAATAQLQEEHVREFIDDQTASFANYIPEEAQRLEDSVIIRKGKYVVLSVSNNPDAAKNIIKNAF